MFDVDFCLFWNIVRDSFWFISASLVVIDQQHRIQIRFCDRMTRRSSHYTFNFDRWVSFFLRILLLGFVAPLRFCCVIKFIFAPVLFPFCWIKYCREYFVRAKARVDFFCGENLAAGSGLALLRKGSVGGHLMVLNVEVVSTVRSIESSLKLHELFAHVLHGTR